MPVQQDNQALVLQQSQIIIGLFMSMQLKSFLDQPVFRVSCPGIQVEILWWNRRGRLQLATSLSIFSKGSARRESSHTMAHRQWWPGAPCLLPSTHELCLSLPPRAALPARFHLDPISNARAKHPYPINKNSPQSYEPDSSTKQTPLAVA